MNGTNHRSLTISGLDNDILRYITERDIQPGERIPSLGELSKELRVGIGKLREQLEVAREMGIVEVRPKIGVTVKEYSFMPAVRWSLVYALARNHADFEDFSNLRNHVEFAYFFEAVAQLVEEDHAALREIVREAWAKLGADPIRIPHAEHRALHITIFSRLQNPFVTGILESYWEAYEAVGLSVYSDYEYLREVWRYHEGVVNNIIKGDNDEAYRLLVEHSRLLQHHGNLTKTSPRKRRDAEKDDK